MRPSSWPQPGRTVAPGEGSGSAELTITGWAGVHPGKVQPSQNHRTAPTRLLVGSPPRAPGTCGSPHPSPWLSGAACMDPQAFPSVTHWGPPSPHWRGGKAERPLLCPGPPPPTHPAPNPRAPPHPETWQPQPPVPTESWKLGPCGRSWQHCCRRCSSSGSATLGGRSQRCRASWSRYPRALCRAHSEGEVVWSREGQPPALGSPGTFTEPAILLGGSPHLSLWKFQVGEPIGAPNAGGVSNHSETSIPEHWPGPAWSLG